MMRKIEVAVTGRYEHTVVFVLTSHRILQVRYLNHPGLSTRALARAYRMTRYVMVEVCSCMNLADSLTHREFRHVRDMISRGLAHKDVEEVLAPLGLSIQLTTSARERRHAP